MHIFETTHIVPDAKDRLKVYAYAPTRSVSIAMGDRLQFSVSFLPEHIEDLEQVLNLLWAIRDEEAKKAADKAAA